MRLDARPGSPLAQPVVLRHRRRLARLQIGGDQEQKVRAAPRQHAPDLWVLQPYSETLPGLAIAAPVRTQCAKWHLST